MPTIRVALSNIKPNPDNPRIIKDDKFRKLVESIRSFPEMLELRPIVVNADNVVLGGNMRLRACQAAGMKEVPVLRADTLTPDQQREFIIKDNVGFGEWDWDDLANEWDAEELDAWGLDVPVPEDENEEENLYTTKIDAPVYTIRGDKPLPNSTYDKTRVDTLLSAIETSKVSDEEKQLLRAAATRHIVFDYAQLAELYAHSEPEMQRLMEDSALVIIDFNRAIELGYAKITKEMLDVFEEEYEPTP
jgi:hypothetical protein